MSVLPLSITARLRFLLVAIGAFILLAAVSTSSEARAHPSGGIGSAGGAGSAGHSSDDRPGSSDRSIAKYERLWDRAALRDKRWARRTAKCESGGDPDAIGGGGRYRGAFQFLRSTWKRAPRSPGGDPVAYPYRTQAVVAVLLKNRDGAGHWPVCG